MRVVMASHSDAEIPPRTASLAAVENRREMMFERPRRGHSTIGSEVSRLTLTIQSLNRLKPRLSGLQQHPYASDLLTVDQYTAMLVMSS